MNCAYYFLFFISCIPVTNNLLTMQKKYGPVTKTIEIDIDVNKEKTVSHAEKFKEILSQSTMIVTSILNENNNCTKQFSPKNITALNTLMEVQDYTAQQIELNPVKIYRQIPSYAKQTALALACWQNFIKQGKVKETWYEKLKEISDTLNTLEKTISQESPKVTFNLQASL